MRYEHLPFFLSMELTEMQQYKIVTMVKTALDIASKITDKEVSKECFQMLISTMPQLMYDQDGVSQELTAAYIMSVCNKKNV